MAATTPDLVRDRRIGAADRRLADLALGRTLSTEGIRISWGGVLAAVGLLLLLAALGMAVGVTATDPQAAKACRRITRFSAPRTTAGRAGP